MENSTPNLQRFTGLAQVYDRHRPKPPAALAEVLCRLAQVERPSLVVDLGCGTGLSTRFWAASARRVTGVEPNADMLQQARLATPQPNVDYRQAVSHATGLPDGCAELVTCSQSLHWMEPQPTFQEARRLLRLGGVFAAYDCDWPPFPASWQLAQAYQQVIERVHAREQKGEGHARRWHKSEHLSRMQTSGVFRFTGELLLHSTEPGDAERLTGLLLSFGSVAAVLRAGAGEDELGITHLRQLAERELGDRPQPWHFSYRLRYGIV